MTLSVGNYTLQSAEQVGNDERGLLWMWETPQQNAEYVIGIDPTVGLTGWSRWTGGGEKFLSGAYTGDDAKTDNAVIEVLRKAKRAGEPDVQVAEFAAPCDPYELAPIVNFIGRLYAGNNEEQQALACIEVYPGPGLWTQNELVNRFGYINLPPWRYEDGLLPKLTKKYGWFSSKASRRDLWIRGIRHITTGGITINSPWLVEEMTKCVQDNFLSVTSRAAYGAKDDRVVATLIAIWYAHEWGLEMNAPEAAPLEVSGGADYQAMDCTAEEMSSMWSDKFAQLSEE